MADLAATERAKYEKVWRESELYHTQSPGVRHALEIAGWYQANECKNLLDFGAGDGRTLDELERYGVMDSAGLDIAEHEHPHVVQCNLWDPMHGNVTDFGLCCDVLEHIPEQYVETVLENIGRAIRVAAWLQIAYFPHVVEGETVHLTVKDHAWWVHRVNKYFRIAHAWERNRRGVFYLLKARGQT